MPVKEPGYFGSLWQAILGKKADAPAPAETTALKAEIASLQMEIAERDKNMEIMQKEYVQLGTARDKGIADAGQEQTERLFKKLVGPLSNLATLAGLRQAGQQVSMDDLIHLFHDLEKELAKFGLLQIGQVGETCGFDTTLHQRMSGGTVHIGTPVVIRIPGYKSFDKILLKAMITPREGVDERNSN